MTPVETITNLGKLFGFVGVAMFLLLTALAQWTYWTKNATKDLPHMTKKFKRLYKFGFYEFWAFAIAGLIFITIAITRALWWYVVGGW